MICKVSQSLCGVERAGVEWDWEQMWFTLKQT